MKYSGNVLGILADDLTGACDTALQFFNAGSPSNVLIDYKALPQNEEGTFVVNTETRHCDEYDAVAAVKKSVHFLIEQFGIDAFYKKLDSTFRGHVAEECLAMLDELRWKACIIAPAYPEQERITVGGYQLVAGVPLELTDAASDPLAPVKQSHLPSILAEQSSERIVGHIPLSTVVHGAGPIKRAMLEAIEGGKKLIVVDACSDLDLEQLALAITLMPTDAPVLPCGSAGLAKAMTKKWVHKANPNSFQYDDHRDDDDEAPTLSIPKKPVLLVMGSMHSVSRLQIETLMQHAQDYNLAGGIHYSPVPAGVLMGQRPSETVVEDVISHLKAGKNVLLTSSGQKDQIEETQQLAKALKLIDDELPRQVNSVLSDISKAVLTAQPAHLILSGGETANGICRKIGSKRLTLLRQLETSISLTVDQNERYIVTKSGGFGDRMTLLNLIKRLEELSD